MWFTQDISVHFLAAAYASLPSFSFHLSESVNSNTPSHPTHPWMGENCHTWHGIRLRGRDGTIHTHFHIHIHVQAHARTIKGFGCGLLIWRALVKNERVWTHPLFLRLTNSTSHTTAPAKMKKWAAVFSGRPGGVDLRDMG
ncbi:hypothetical protein BKA57DRAFT_69248 [Linnemannia elongata]|nr:hypothetical protein BKA57DRAFT_69248 [Linnemannia elongata]